MYHYRYTSKAKAVYATFLSWPSQWVLQLPSPVPSPATNVSLKSVNADEKKQTPLKKNSNLTNWTSTSADHSPRLS